jgi:hypothetical protein
MQLARRRAEITEVIRRGSADLSLAAALQQIKKNPPTVEAQVMESIETDAAIAGNSPEIESDPDEAAILAKRAEHTIVNGAAPIVGSWAAQPDAVVAPPAPAPEPDLTAWLGRDKDDRHAFLKAALGTIGLDDLLAALPSGWGVEIDRRVIDQHAAKRSPLSERLTKALRSALSQSKTDHQPQRHPQDARGQRARSARRGAHGRIQKKEGLNRNSRISASATDERSVAVEMDEAVESPALRRINRGPRRARPMSNMLTLRPEVETVTVKVPPREVTGRYLAHNRLTPVERAFLAADIVTGRAKVVDHTATQVMEMAGTNATYMAAASKLSPSEGKLVEAGVRPLIEAKSAEPAKPAGRFEPLLPGILMDDEDALAAIVRRIGVDQALDTISAVEAEEAEA